MKTNERERVTVVGVRSGLDDKTRQALAARLLAFADDELVLAHRNSEWTGHGPILEEDIAFSNIAQDEMGHALLWYGLNNELTGTDPDELVFHRKATEYRNVQFVELPRGDWAFTLCRQYLFDSYESILLGRLAGSAYAPLAGAAGKMRSEEIYHVRHTGAWMRRLGMGTEFSNQRMQDALSALWPFAAQLFAVQPGDERLVAADILPDLNNLGEEWRATVLPFLELCGLEAEGSWKSFQELSRSIHTEHLVTMLSEMQEVARLDREAKW